MIESDEGYAELREFFASHNWQGKAAELVKQLKVSIADIRNGLDNVD